MGRGLPLGGFAPLELRDEPRIRTSQVSLDRTYRCRADEYKICYSYIQILPYTGRQVGR